MVYSIILLSGILFLVFLGYFSLQINFVVTSMLFVLFIYQKISVLNFINKIKYFLIALLFIYALATPGKVLYFYSVLSITEEGVLLGINNLLRILNTFMTIFFLMKIIPQNHIVRFIVKVFYPLSYVGLDIDRLTVRLYLTLSYLDHYRNYSFKYSELADLLNQQVFQNKKKYFNPNIIKITSTYFDLLWLVGFISILFLVKFFIL